MLELRGEGGGEPLKVSPVRGSGMCLCVCESSLAAGKALPAGWRRLSATREGENASVPKASRVRGDADTQIRSWEGLTSGIPGRQHGKSAWKRLESAPCHRRRRSGQREEINLSHTQSSGSGVISSRAGYKFTMEMALGWAIVSSSCFGNFFPRWNGKSSFLVK